MIGPSPWRRVSDNSYADVRGELIDPLDAQLKVLFGGKPLVCRGTLLWSLTTLLSVDIDVPRSTSLSPIIVPSLRERTFIADVLWTIYYKLEICTTVKLYTGIEQLNTEQRMEPPLNLSPEIVR